ncbi:MAG: hypothetical protein ABSA09_00480 [Desulfobaccales bacterium]|jgi:hypothetical protein
MKININTLLKHLDRDGDNYLEAARVAQLTSLKEINLVNAKISRKPRILSGMFPEALSLKHKCEAELLPYQLDKNDNLLSILCIFQVVAFNDDPPNQLIMKIEATFCTSYELKFNLKDLDLKEHFDETVEVVVNSRYFMFFNPVSNAWPYWREFVRSMSTRMGFPALMVPMLLEIVPEKKPEKKAKQNVTKKQSTERKKISA